MSTKITEKDKVNLASQVICRRASLKDKRIRFFLKRAEHPLYQAITTMVQSIGINNKEGIPDHSLVTACKRVRKKLQSQLQGTLEYQEYLIAISEFKEVKDLYTFAQSIEVG